MYAPEQTTASKLWLKILHKKLLTRAYTFSNFKFLSATVRYINN